MSFVGKEGCHSTSGAMAKLPASKVPKFNVSNPMNLGIRVSQAQAPIHSQFIGGQKQLINSTGAKVQGGMEDHPEQCLNGPSDRRKLNIVVDQIHETASGLNKFLWNAWAF